MNLRVFDPTLGGPNPDPNYETEYLERTKLRLISNDISKKEYDSLRKTIAKLVNERFSHLLIVKAIQYTSLT